MITTPVLPFRFFREPDRVLFVFEGGTHIWRVIYMDGRQHPKTRTLRSSGIRSAMGRRHVGNRRGRI